MPELAQELEMVEQVYELIVSFLVTYSFQIAGAMVILVAGFIVAGWVARALLRMQEHRDVDVTLRQFIASAARLTVIALFLMIAMSKLGVSITPFIAAIGGLALGASFAIQGPVSNYGAGLVIILTRMFKVGDTISVQGCAGLVTHIDLAATQLVAEDGEVIVIPNKHIVGEIHRNTFGNRLVEGHIGIDGGADPARASTIIKDVLAASDDIPDTPEPVIGIEDFRESAIIVGYRYWVPTTRYFELMYDVNNRVHRDLGAAGIGLAVQQHAIQISKD